MSESEDIVCMLIKKKFSTLSYDEKKTIIDNGRPIPDMKDLKSIYKKNGKDYERKFNSDLYKNHQWLTGSTILNKLFCWPCIIFKNKTDTVWSSTGYSDINHVHEKIPKHALSVSHITNSLALNTFGESRIEYMFDHQRKIGLQNFNSEVKKNRKAFEILLDVTIFLAIHELPFRGHNETENSLNKGNFKDLCDYTATYDIAFKNFMENSAVFKGTSALIQNDIIEAINNTMLNFIKSELQETNFVAIQFDETTDISRKAQLSCILRYVNKNGEPIERFLKFSDVSKDQSANGISKVILTLIDELEIGPKLVAQVYDGAPVMSGQVNGVQAQIKKKYKQALYIHCNAHILNLVLSKSVQTINETKQFFTTIGSLAAFFSTSSKRDKLLQDTLNKKIPSVCNIKWSYNSRILNLIQKERLNLIEIFDLIIDSPDSWGENTTVLARGYIHFLSQFKTIFILNIFYEIFSFTDVLYNILQKKSLDINACLKEITNCKENITKLYNNNKFDAIINKTIEEYGQDTLPPKRNEDVSYFKKIYDQIFNKIISEIDVRYKDLSNIKFIHLLNCDKFTEFIKKFPTDLLTSLKDAYGCVIKFNYLKLENELKVIFNSECYKNKSVTEIANTIIAAKLEETFSESVQLCHLIMTIPSTTATTERSFSTLKRIKTFNRSTMSNDRLSALSLLAIEKEFLVQLRQNPSFNFFEQIIQHFTEKSRRINLMYKKL